jgi:hypothetical protein
MSTGVAVSKSGPLACTLTVVPESPQLGRNAKDGFCPDRRRSTVMMSVVMYRATMQLITVTNLRVESITGATCYRGENEYSAVIAYVKCDDAKSFETPPACGRRRHGRSRQMRPA